VKSIARGCAVVGAEPEQADDTFRSFRSGSRQSVQAPQTIADGLRATLGALNFELLRSHVDDVVLVSERQIIDAMRIVLQDFKLLIEPSSAVPVAAALAGKLGREGQRVGIVITGGNVDLDQCPFLRGEQAR
jgi:threonine dehydratase